ncbi:MAG: acylphosphatase [Planctomycetes bacterium]|nr:acylphosphatase [Planctomycetota bacterium]
MIKRIILKIQGRVQGVFFRASLLEVAGELGLTGFVRNEPDGSVYAEAEGGEENLKKLAAWCRQGSPGAKVSKVDHEFSDKIKKFSNFEIL